MLVNQYNWNHSIKAHEYRNNLHLMKSTLAFKLSRYAYDGMLVSWIGNCGIPRNRDWDIFTPPPAIRAASMFLSATLSGFRTLPRSWHSSTELKMNYRVTLQRVKWNVRNALRSSIIVSYSYFTSRGVLITARFLRGRATALRNLSSIP